MKPKPQPNERGLTGMRGRDQLRREVCGKCRRVCKEATRQEEMARLHIISLLCSAVSTLRKWWGVAQDEVDEVDIVKLFIRKE